MSCTLNYPIQSNPVYLTQATLFYNGNRALENAGTSAYQLKETMLKSDIQSQSHPVLTQATWPIHTRYI